MTQQIEVIYFPENGSNQTANILIDDSGPFKPSELTNKIIRTNPEAKQTKGWAFKVYRIQTPSSSETRKFLLLFYSASEQNSPIGSINLNFEKWVPKHANALKIDPQFQTSICGPLFLVAATQPDPQKLRYMPFNISDLKISI